MFLAMLAIPTFASQSVYMVIEQDPWDNAAHRAADLSYQVDGLDPVLQFILLETPDDPEMAQVLWEASETPIVWVHGGDEQQTYRLVEHAILPDEGKIDYRIIDKDNETELREHRHSRDADDQNIYIDASILDSLPEGDYTLQAILRIPNRQMQIMEQDLTVIDSFENFEDPNESSEDLPPPPVPIEGEKLEPGNGWNGPTTVPQQVGDNHEPAIAHWNVVPEQQIEDGFTVGVIAHHLDGIRYVEISANNGPWIRIDNPSINPRTQCEEYWTTLDIGNRNEKIELRAIAVPHEGKPVLVHPLGTTYQNQDLTLYPYEVGAVLELGAGEHNLKAQSLPDVGYLVIRPMAGLSREDVVIVGESRDWRDGRLKLENLTIQFPEGGGGLMGRYNMNEDQRQVGNHVWLDNCRIIGAPLGDKHNEDTWWMAHQWETSTYTNCEISHISKVFMSARHTKTLTRNCYIHNVYEDVFNAAGLHVNITIEDLDRTPQVVAQRLTGSDVPHPDLWQHKTWSNTIVQDVTAVKNINAQGFFIQSGWVNSVAIVRANIETQAPWRVFQPQVEVANWLIKDSTLIGGQSFSRAEVTNGERLLIDNTPTLDIEAPGVIIK